ncbi:diaminopimelate epimerase [Roseivirga sp. BDSF3-8]|uniref:diaminopimelate epimerase n=1 Tax=Roseivirga sp. BDSF3-8 TaxID=3241598 RepID=UPI003531F706
MLAFFVITLIDNPLIIKLMTHITFYKYQGTGNDFVMIDNRSQAISRDNLSLIRQLCDRRFGIGADGLIMIENHPEADFEMVYFNADGSMSMCGNGARCAVMFARQLKIIENTTVFIAIDGRHSAFIKDGLVHLLMGKPGPVITRDTDRFVDTGSPHHIRFVKNLQEYDVVTLGRKIRYGVPYLQEGTNVNFVEDSGGEFSVRTYERGVEDETYSCGTGVTAVALALSSEKAYPSPIKIKTRGGQLQVSFEEKNGQFDNVYLIGPAKFVFEGIINPEIL